MFLGMVKKESSRPGVVGDNLALEVYPSPQEISKPGEVCCEGQGKDVALISYGNGAYLSR